MRKRYYKEYLDDGLLTLKANDGVVCLREAPLGPYKDAIALRPIEDADALDFYAMLLEQSMVVDITDDETPSNEVDQMRDFEADLENILQERRVDWRLTEVSIRPDCMLLEYENMAGGTQLLHVDYGRGLNIHFKMAPTVFGHPATYELYARERTPGEDGEPRWFVDIKEDLYYVRRTIRFDGEDEDGRILLDVTERCGY